MEAMAAYESCVSLAGGIGFDLRRVIRNMPAEDMMSEPTLVM